MYFRRREDEAVFYTSRLPAHAPHFSKMDRVLFGEDIHLAALDAWLQAHGHAGEIVPPTLATLTEVGMQARALAAALTSTNAARQSLAFALIRRGKPVAAVYDAAQVSEQTFRRWLVDRDSEELLVPEEVWREFEEHALALRYERADEVRQVEVRRLKRRTLGGANRAEDERFNSLLERFHHAVREYEGDHGRYVPGDFGADEIDEIGGQIAGILYQEALTRLGIA